MTTLARHAVRLLIAMGVLAFGAPPAAAAPDRDLKLGETVVVAGTGEEGYSGDGGPARDARLGKSLGVSVAPDGTVYLADLRNGRVRAVRADGVIDTVPGTRVLRAPETGSPASLPLATAVAADGTLYVAGTEDVRRRNPDGTATVIAGGGDQTFADGGDGGPATSARLGGPSDVAVDAAGNVYVADRYDHRIRKVDTEGVITTVAGGGPGADIVEGGPATQASLYRPESVAVDSRGNVYFTGEMRSAVWRVGPDGTITTVVGNQPIGFSGDGGPAGGAQIGDRVSGLAVDREHNLYFIDRANKHVRMVDPDGTITTVGPAIFGRDLAVGPDGDAYVAQGAEVIRVGLGAAEPDGPEQEAPDESRFADREPGTVVTVAGTGRGLSAAEVERRAQPAPPPGPDDLAAGPDGVVYFVDTDRNRVSRIAPDGDIGVLAGTEQPGGSGDGGPAKDARLQSPGGVAVGADGSVFIADTGNGLIRKVDTAGTIDAVAGSESSGVHDVTVDGAGNLYLTEGRGVVRIDAATGPTLVAGGGNRWAGDADGKPATDANLWGPGPVAVDRTGPATCTSSRPAARRSAWCARTGS